MAAVETKVKASTAAGAVSGLALWALGRYVFRDSGVPDVVASWVYVLVPGLVTFAAGYLARHTSVPAAAAVAAGAQYRADVAELRAALAETLAQPGPPGAVGEKPGPASGGPQ